MDQVTFVEQTFRSIVVAGSAYEMGRQYAAAIADDPERVARYTSADPDTDTVGLNALCERVCPGLSEELHGFADGLGVDPAHLLFYQVVVIRPPADPHRACSQIAVLPPITADGHVLVARTDEGGLEMQDLCLVVARREGALAHLGFSILLLGRSDGMNERGLCVTTSAGGAYDTPATTSGVIDALVVRAILDTCATVGEALALLREWMPVNSTNLILTDAGGRAALVEANDGSYAMREIDAALPAETEQAYLCAGNHTTLPGMTDYNRYVNPHLLENSRTRMATIAARLKAARSQVTLETLRGLLSTHIPAGLCAHHYHLGFGTIFQLLYDVTARTAEVCFGPSTNNPWRPVGLDEPAGVKIYPAVFPQR